MISKEIYFTTYFRNSRLHKIPSKFAYEISVQSTFEDSDYRKQFPYVFAYRISVRSTFEDDRKRSLSKFEYTVSTQSLYLKTKITENSMRSVYTIIPEKMFRDFSKNQTPQSSIYKKHHSYAQ